MTLEECIEEYSKPMKREVFEERVSLMKKNLKVSLNYMSYFASLGKTVQAEESERQVNRLLAQLKLMDLIEVR